MPRRLAGIPGFGIDRVAEAAGRDPEVLRLENYDTDIPPHPDAVEATRAAIGRDDANSYLPFSGLDVTSAMMLRSLLRVLADRGKMVLYSSHVLEVVEKVCSTVVILRKGEVAAYDSIGRLRELMSQPSLEGVFAQLADVEDGESVARKICEVMQG